MFNEDEVLTLESSQEIETSKAPIAAYPYPASGRNDGCRASFRDT